MSNRLRVEKINNDNGKLLLLSRLLGTDFSANASEVVSTDSPSWWGLAKNHKILLLAIACWSPQHKAALCSPRNSGDNSQEINLSIALPKKFLDRRKTVFVATDKNTRRKRSKYQQNLKNLLFLTQFLFIIFCLVVVSFSFFPARNKTDKHSTMYTY